MIYLASPYSDPDAQVREARFRAACHKTADMTRDGVLVYSPIVHSHPLSLLGLPSDWPFWEPHNREMLGLCSSLLVLQIPGWEVSRGIAAEVEIAHGLGLPTRFEAMSAGDTAP